MCAACRAVRTVNYIYIFRQYLPENFLKQLVFAVFGSDFAPFSVKPLLFFGASTKIRRVLRRFDENIPVIERNHRRSAGNFFVPTEKR